MNFKDQFGVVLGSFIFGILLSCIAYFFFKDFYNNYSNSFWISSIILGIIIIPFYFKLVKKSQTCINCNQPYKTFATHEEDIREYVKWTRKTEWNNGQRHTYNVPVNVREYTVYTKCGSCGFESSYDTSEED